MNKNRFVQRKPRIPYDRILETRVIKFLDNTSDPYLSAEYITDHLRENHSEYMRMKKTIFRAMVAQAYSNYLNSEEVELEESESSSDEDDSDGDDGDGEPHNLVEVSMNCNNRANNSFSKLYSKLNNKNKVEDCIDITSDASDTEKETAKDEKKDNKICIDKKGDKVDEPKSNNDIDKTDENNDSIISIVEEKINVKLPKSKSVSLTNGHSTNKETPKTKVLQPVKRKAVNSDMSLSESKRKKREIIPTETNLSFKDIGGNERVLKDIVKLSLHMKHIEIYSSIGEPPPRGFLLHGPPGSGKTLLAHALAGELKVPLLKVAGPEIIGGISGQSEERIRDLFDQAIEAAPCIVFFDEVDAISPDRESASKDMERRIVAQLLTSLDTLEMEERAKQVLVIGATNRPDSIDPALRRAGRFEREVCLGIPDRDSRLDILKVVTKDRKLSSDVSLDFLAERTPGYVGADLKALMRESALSAISRVSMDLLVLADQDLKVTSATETEDNLKVKDPELRALLTWYNDNAVISEEQLLKVFITKQDFENALKVVQPSSKREGFATVPNVTWDDVGSLKDIRHQLQMSIMFPVKYPKLFGKSTPSGVLLCGPPGCGKTLLAKAVANEAGINFISVKGPELLNMYLGESERAVRQVFQRARNSQPCVIFFDEIDALCPKRSSFSDSSSSMRIVNQLLTEMDGFEGRGGVFLMAATNRPDIIDPAVMRPGRFDRVLFVNLPNQLDRTDILLALTKQGKEPLMGDDVDFEKISIDIRCDGYSGADLEQLVKEAREQAILEIVTKQEKEEQVSDTEEVVICYRHFDTALTRIKPSVSQDECKNYSKLRDRYTSKAN